MIRLVLSILLIFTGYFLSLGTTSCFGLDEGGCLTCHQYPGLVRLEKADGVKVLHIDEEKFFSSPHGKILCKKCHTTVTKVPHTGETGTDCTSECHQKDADKIADYPGQLGRGYQYWYYYSIGTIFVFEDPVGTGEYQLMSTEIM